MSRLYKAVLPRSNQSSYSANENIDFNINCEGQTIKQGSIRLNGTLKVTNPGANTQMDGLTGIHSVISNITTISNERICV